MACAGFDGQVVRQDSKLNHLADKFVKVRLVQMKDVDLSQFQFDYDLTWSVISMNPDGTIYGRYGSRSVGGPMTYNSMVSLEKAMERVLVLHHNYPRNRKSLNGKNHPPPHWKTAADIPGLRKRRRKQLIQPTNQKNCVHCHNIYDGWIETAYDQGTFDQQSLWIYPLPKNIGFKINVDQGNLVETILPDSLAQKAGIHAGDRIVSMKDQPIISIADIQWVQHHLPKVANLSIEIERNGKVLSKIIAVSGNWRRTDISWRASMWSLQPKVGIHAPEISEVEKSELGLDPQAMALQAKWIPNKGAREAGLRNGDIIIEVAGNKKAISTAQFNLFIRLNYDSGDRVPVKVLRHSKVIPMELPMP